MAMASSSTLLSRINEDYLTCRICMDTYKDPKVLTCQHSFCLRCLEGCNKSENGLYIPCPVCRQETLLGTKGINGLKNNFVFLNMIEMLATWKRTRSNNSPTKSDEQEDVDTMCDTCPTKESTMATFQCLDCLDQLCADCAAFHSRTKMTKDHEVVPLHEVESGMHQKRIHAQELSRCFVHENIQMKHFCTECMAVVCRECVLEAHQSHRITTLAEAEDIQKKEVIKMKEELESGLQKLENSLSEVICLEKEECKRASEVKQSVTDSIENFIHLLKERQEALLDEIEVLSKENLSKITSCKDGLETQMSCSENCVQFIDYVLQDGVPVEIITVQGQMMETVKQLHQKIEEVTIQNAVVTTTFNKFDFQSTNLNLQSWGEIRVTSRKNTPGRSTDKEVLNDKISAKVITTVKTATGPPKLPPKPSPRRNLDDKPKIPIIKAPVPLSRVTKPKPVRRQSLSDQDGNLVQSSWMAKSTMSLFPNISDSRYEIKRSAPKPPTKPKQPDIKRTCPPKKMAPEPPTMINSKNNSPEIMTVSRKSPEPIKATLSCKFGKKGKMISNGELLGPPRCVIFSGIKRKMLVLDRENRHILVFNIDGWFKKSFKVAIPDKGQAKPVAMAELGKQYIIVLYKSFAVKWGWDGSIGHIWGTTDLVDAHGIAVDSKGRIIISDQERHMIFIYDSHTMQKVFQFGGFGDRDDLFRSPRHITTNNQDMIIVSDHHNNCIKYFSKGGKFLFKFGEIGAEDGQLRFPESVTCITFENGSEGLLVADQGNCRVSLFSSRGRFINHVLIKTENNMISNPQCISVSLYGKGEEMVVIQMNQIQLRVYRLSKLVDK